MLDLDLQTDKVRVCSIEVCNAGCDLQQFAWFLSLPLRMYHTVYQDVIVVFERLS